MPTHKLTKYPIGSLRELLIVAIPLMISHFASTAMLFVDRMILAQYSLEAMNASSIVGTVVFLLEYFLINIAIFSEVLVAKLNGQKRIDQITRPTWQMVWMSIASTIIYLIIAFTASRALIPAAYYEAGEPYFRILMYGASLSVLHCSFAAFFIGVGKTKVVVFSTIVGNVVNLILDVILIFGIEGLVPEMGIRGAAIASNTGLVAQTLIIFFAFISPKLRAQYNTHKPKFDWIVLKRCLRLGLPTSIGITFELSAWAFVLYFLPSISPLHITVFAMGQSLFIGITFITDGIKKAVVTLISNCIGAKYEEKNLKIIIAGFKVFFLFTLIFYTFGLLFAPDIIDVFIADNADHAITQVLMDNARLIVFLIVTFFMLEGVNWIFSGLLTAYEYTKFIMVVTTCAAWLASALPVYYIFSNYDLSFKWVWVIFSTYPLVSAIVFIGRSVGILRKTLVK